MTRRASKFPRRPFERQHLISARFARGISQLNLSTNRSQGNRVSGIDGGHYWSPVPKRGAKSSRSVGTVNQANLGGTSRVPRPLLARPSPLSLQSLFRLRDQRQKSPGLASAGGSLPLGDVVFVVVVVEADRVGVLKDGRHNTRES